MDSSTPGFSIPGLGPPPTFASQPDAVSVNHTSFDANSIVPAASCGGGNADKPEGNAGQLGDTGEEDNQRVLADVKSESSDEEEGQISEEPARNAIKSEPRSSSPDYSMVLEEALDGLYDDPVDGATSTQADPTPSAGAKKAGAESLGGGTAGSINPTGRDHPPSRNTEADLISTTANAGAKGNVTGKASDEWEDDSDPYQSTESSSESSEEGECGSMDVNNMVKLLMEKAEEDDPDDDSARPPRTFNEAEEEPAPPKPDITILPTMPIKLLGAVHSIVGNDVLIRGRATGKERVLDAGSVLCTSNRTVLGALADTLGQVTDPHYVLKFASENEFKASNLQIGTEVHYSDEHAKFTMTEPLLAVKGTDASNAWDEEVPEEEREASDDEKEAEHQARGRLKRKASQVERNHKRLATGRASQRGSTTNSSRQPVPPGGLNYDDDEEDDGPYKPLSRPSHFGQGPQASSEERRPGAGPQPGFQVAFRGRGDFRGGRSKSKSRWERRARSFQTNQPNKSESSGPQSQQSQQQQQQQQHQHQRQQQQHGGAPAQAPTGPKSDGHLRPPIGPKGYQPPHGSGRQRTASPLQNFRGHGKQQKHGFGHQQHQLAAQQSRHQQHQQNHHQPHAQHHQQRPQQQSQQQQNHQSQQQNHQHHQQSQSQLQPQTQSQAQPQPPQQYNSGFNTQPQAAAPPPPAVTGNNQNLNQFLAAFAAAVAAGQGQAAPPPPSAPPPAAVPGFQFSIPPAPAQYQAPVPYQAPAQYQAPAAFQTAAPYQAPAPFNVPSNAAPVPAPQGQFNPALLAAAMQALQNQQAQQRQQAPPPPPPPQDPRDPRRRF